MKTVAVEARVREHLHRAGVYRLLGAAFAYPGPDRLEAVAELAGGLAGAAAPPLGPLLGALVGETRSADPAAAAAEHVFLFDREARCPPYEGAWGEAPQPAGKAALLADIAGFYAAFGLQPGAAHADLEDHIGAECEFMSALAFKEAYALAEGDEEGARIIRTAQSRFVGDHLGRWCGAFSDALKEASPLPYYGVLADLLGAWVQAETARLDATPAVVRGRSGSDPLQEADAFTCPMAEPEPAPGGAHEAP